MKIDLIDNYYIETDPANFILKESYVGEDDNGKEKKQVRTHGYYSTLEGALHGLIESKSLSDDSELVIEQYLQKTKEWVEELSRDIKKTANKVE